MYVHYILNDFPNTDIERRTLLGRDNSLRTLLSYSPLLGLLIPLCFSSEGLDMNSFDQDHTPSSAKLESTEGWLQRRWFSGYKRLVGGMARWIRLLSHRGGNQLLAVHQSCQLVTDVVVYQSNRLSCQGSDTSATGGPIDSDQRSVFVFDNTLIFNGILKRELFHFSLQ